MAHARILSFKYALEGIWTAVKEEPNIKIHLLIMTLVILFGIYFNLTILEWIIVIFCIGMVITLELTNTAIETVVDSFIDKEHPGAKRAKDVASGAVLVMALTAAAIGLIIFLPYFVRLLM